MCAECKAAMMRREAAAGLLASTLALGHPIERSLRAAFPVRQDTPAFLLTLAGKLENAR